MQLVYYDFIVDIKHRFICGERKLKCCKAPKCYVQDCLMILHLLSTILPSSNDSCLWNTPVFILKRKFCKKKTVNKSWKLSRIVESFKSSGSEYWCLKEIGKGHKQFFYGDNLGRNIRSNLSSSSTLKDSQLYS